MTHSSKPTLPLDVIKHKLLPFLWPSQILLLRQTCSKLAAELSNDAFLENMLDDAPLSDPNAIRNLYSFHEVLPYNIEFRILNFLSTWEQRIFHFFHVKVRVLMPRKVLTALARHSASELLITKHYTPTDDPMHMDGRAHGPDFYHFGEQSKFVDQYVQWDVLYSGNALCVKRKLHEKPYLATDVETHAQHILDSVGDVSEAVSASSVAPFLLPLSFREIDDYGNKNYNFLVYDAHTWVDGQKVRLEQYPVVYLDDEDVFYSVDRDGTAFLGNKMVDEDDDEPHDRIWSCLSASCWPSHEPLPLPRLSDNAIADGWRVAEPKPYVVNLKQWAEDNNVEESYVYRLDLHFDHLHMVPSAGIIVSKRTGDVLEDESIHSALKENFNAQERIYSHDNVNRKWYVLRALSEEFDYQGCYAIGNQFWMYKVETSGDALVTAEEISLKRKRDEMEADSAE